MGASRWARSMKCTLLWCAAVSSVAAMESGQTPAEVPAHSVATAADTAAAADSDTVPTLPGIALPEGVDWRRIGQAADLDSLLLDGKGIVLAFEDTFAFDKGTADTFLVSAPRVTVAEVMKSIADKSEYDRYRMGSYEYTTLTTIVSRDGPGVDSPVSAIHETAIRFHHDRENGDQMVTLWERERKFKDGEVSKEKVDDSVKAQWMPMQRSVIGMMPAERGSATRYRYTIEDRKLVGNSLIYRIGFAPRSRFDALPSGQIWVDYSNWVIRKIEARMTGAVPFPLFLKSVPVFRQSQERFGEYWFPTDAYLRVNLRHVPLLPIPDNIEVRVQLRDIVINGVAQQPQDRVGGQAGPLNQAGGLAQAPDAVPDTSGQGFWLSAAASNDSLAAYWGELDRQWAAAVSPDLAPVALDEARIDSLTEVGDTRLVQLRTGGLWQLQVQPLKIPDYNRVQGFAPWVGLGIAKMGPARPRLDLLAGYGFANKRPVFQGQLDLPLVRSRWKLRPPATLTGEQTGAEDFEELPGSRYTKLNWRLMGTRNTELFAGDGRRHLRSASAFFYGRDPNQYFERRGWGTELELRLGRHLSLGVHGGVFRHRALKQQTNWNAWGRTVRPAGNLPALGMRDRQAAAVGHWQRGILAIGGGMVWHRVDQEDGSAATGRARNFREWNLAGSLDYMDGMGNRWLLRGRHRQFDGAVPVQWKTWLGDYGSLRGYRAGELVGDAGSAVSLDLRAGVDFWKWLHVPLLKDWGLQPLGFVDWGHTWDQGPPLPGGGLTGSGPYLDGQIPGARGWRMDAGFGFGRRFDLPGLGEFNNIRIYAAHRIADEVTGEGWRVLLAVEK